MNGKFAPAFQTRDKFLALALLSLGVPPDPRQAWERTKPETGPPRTLYFFCPASDCGNYVAADIRKEWERAAEYIERAGPIDPVAAAFACCLNLAAVEAVAEREPCYVIQRGHSFGLVDPREVSRPIAETILSKMGI